MCKTIWFPLKLPVKWCFSGIMLIQGRGGPGSQNFLMFLTTEMDSLGKNTWNITPLIQSEHLKSKLKAWFPCLRHDSVPLAWFPCLWHHFHAFGIVAMPLAYFHALGIVSMPSAWFHAFNMASMPSAWVHACGMASMLSAWPPCLRRASINSAWLKIQQCLFVQLAFLAFFTFLPFSQLSLLNFATAKQMTLDYSGWS